MPAYATQLRMKKSIFGQATKTRKNTLTTLLTTHPAIRNEHYLAEVDKVTMDKLFKQE